MVIMEVASRTGHRIPYFSKNSTFERVNGPIGPYLLSYLVFVPVIRALADLVSGTL